MDRRDFLVAAGIGTAVLATGNKLVGKQDIKDSKYSSPSALIIALDCDDCEIDARSILDDLDPKHIKRWILQSTDKSVFDPPVFWRKIVVTEFKKDERAGCYIRAWLAKEPLGLQDANERLEQEETINNFAKEALCRFPKSQEIRIIISDEIQFRYAKYEIKTLKAEDEGIYCWVSQKMNCQGEWDNNLELLDENFKFLGDLVIADGSLHDYFGWKVRV